MNYPISHYLQILELNNIDKKEINESLLKKQYYNLARCYHPDKNHNEDSGKKFQEIHDAYENAMKYYKYLHDDGMENGFEENKQSENNEAYPQNVPFSSLWTHYLGHFLHSDLFFEIKTQLFHSIIERLCNNCEHKALDLLKQLDSKMLSKFTSIIMQNSMHLPLSEDFLTQLKEIELQKKDSKKTYILRPKLEDLQEDQLYKLKVQDETLYIPLWHHDLEYEINNEEMNVQIIPCLKENIEIDEKNNIILYKKYNIRDIWQKSLLVFKVGNKELQYNKNDLKMRPLQEIRFPHQGISQISTQNIYNVSKRSDIIVILLIEF